MISRTNLRQSTWSIVAAMVAALLTAPVDAQQPPLLPAQTSGIAVKLCDSVVNSKPVTMALGDQQVVDAAANAASPTVRASFGDPVAARFCDLTAPVEATLTDVHAHVAAPITSTVFVDATVATVQQTAGESSHENEIQGETVGEEPTQEFKQKAIATLTRTTTSVPPMAKTEPLKPAAPTVKVAAAIFKQTQTRRRIQMPSPASSKSNATLPVTRRLADPEKFRVSRFASSRRTFPYQDDVDVEVEGTIDDADESDADSTQPRELPSLSAIRRQGADRNRDREEDFSLLASLPDTSLYDGIGGAPLAEAVSKRQVADPNMTFLVNAMPGADYRDQMLPSTKTWRTPDMVHRPLYFEQPNLERHGISKDRWQPIVSGAHFFTSVVFLPYKVGSTPFSECVYPIGEARPGDCVTPYRAPIEFNRRGFLFQATRAGIVFGGL